MGFFDMLGGHAGASASRYRELARKLEREGKHAEAQKLYRAAENAERLQAKLKK